MTHLFVRTLGRFQVLLDGEPVSGFDSDKVRALLAYLVLEVDRPHRREKLAGLLWPDYPEQSARTSLRSALANLRKVIGDQNTEPNFLLVDRQTIQFNPQSNYELDAYKFSELVEAGTDHLPDTAQIEQAISLYNGDFMEGFSFPDSAIFEEWVLVSREALRRGVLQALQHLTGYYQEQEQHEKALELALRQIEIEPFQETAHQQAMLIWSLAGRRNEALSHYEDFKNTLETELGVAPLKQTQEMYQQLLDGELPSPPTETVILRREPKSAGECPYRGLAAFREEDADFYHGREGFVQQLAEALKRRSLVGVILGSSGAGKSSVVHAGLIPRLRDEEEWLILEFRPGGQAFQALANALSSALEPELSETDRLIESQKLADALETGDLSLINVAERVLEKNPKTRHLLLLADQFEELYTLCPEPELRRRFIDMLLKATQHTQSVILLMTLRADFMGQALSHRPLADALQDGTFILGPMNRDELRTAIQEPAEQQGAAFEPGLISRILDDVGQEPGNLPLLEFALTLMWDQLDQGWFTHAAYEEIGRVEGALARHAEKVYARLDEKEKEMAKRVFVQLVQPGQGTEDTRRIATRLELGADNWPLIQELADRRLVVTSWNEDGQETVELAHEAMISGWGRLRGWIDADRSFRIWQEGLRVSIRGWQSSYMDEGALLRGAPLVQAEDWLNERRMDLSEVEIEFIQISLTQREKEQLRRERRRRRTIFGLTTGLVITFALALIAGWQWLYARDLTRVATARELAAAALNNMDVDPELSILLALEAVDETFETENTVLKEAEEALHRALQESRIQARISPSDERPIYTDFNKDGTRLYTFSVPGAPGNIRIWDAESGELLHTLQPGVAFKSIQDENLLVGLQLDYQRELEIITVWDFNSGEIQELIEVPMALVEPLAVTVDEEIKSYLRPFENGEIEVWDLRAVQKVFVLGSKGDTPIEAADISKDGKKFLTGDSEGVMKIWSLESGDNLLTLPTESGWINDVTFSPDSKLLATAFRSGVVKLWDAETGMELVTFTGHSNEALSLAFDSSGSYLATGGWDRNIKIWDIKTSLSTGIGQELFTLAGHTGAVKELSFSLDGTKLSSLSYDETVRVWNINKDGIRDKLAFVNGSPPGPEWMNTIALSQDGTNLVTTNADQTPKVWNTETKGLVRSLVGHEAPVERVEISPDGKFIATTGHDHKAIIWDSSNGENLLSLDGFNCEVSGAGCDVAFSPDGSNLAVVDYDGFLRVFSYREMIQSSVPNAANFEVSAHDNFIFSVRYSPDGSKIATAGADRFARVWDAHTGEFLYLLGGTRDFNFDAQFSPDGKRIATSHEEGFIQLWDAESGDLLTTLSGHNSSVLRLVFNPDGTRLASGSSDGTVKLWDSISGQELLSIFVHRLGVSDVEFSPDGKKLYASVRDGTTRVLLLDIDELIGVANSRLTRSLTIEECQIYLHLQQCPETPENQR